MKKIMAVMAVLLLLCSLLGCSKETDVLHMGINAVVLGVDLEKNTVMVADPAEEDVFGEACVLVGNDADFEMIYCDFDSQDVRQIELRDLMTGDEITVNVYESELQNAGAGTVHVRQIQLMTQRLQ